MEKTLKIARSRAVLIVNVMVIALVSVISSQSSMADSNHNGAMCHPANLGQAINLNMGWSQLGITNNSAVGENAFFVVCPVNEDFSLLANDEVLVDIVAASADVDMSAFSCSLLWVYPFAGGPTISTVQEAVPFSTYNISAEPGTQAETWGAIIPGGYVKSLDTLTVLCVLPPQLRIARISAISNVPLVLE